MPSTQNQQAVADLKDRIGRAKSVTIVDYSGTSVNDQVKLRRSISDKGGEMLVTKNTLIDLAVGKGKVAESLTGMNAIVLGYTDEVEPIKALFAFQKETEKLTIKQGLLGETILSATDVEKLSKLPGRMELVASLLNRLQAPASGLVNVLKAGQRDLVYALKAISQKGAVA